MVEGRKGPRGRLSGEGPTRPLDSAAPLSSYVFSPFARLQVAAPAARRGGPRDEKKQIKP